MNTDNTESHIDWTKAPKDATHAATSWCGCQRWYMGEPSISIQGLFWKGSILGIIRSCINSPKTCENWRDTLEARPVIFEVEPNFSGGVEGQQDTRQNMNDPGANSLPKDKSDGVTAFLNTGRRSPDRPAESPQPSSAPCDWPDDPSDCTGICAYCGSRYRGNKGSLLGRKCFRCSQASAPDPGEGWRLLDKTANKGSGEAIIIGDECRYKTDPTDLWERASPGGLCNENSDLGWNKDCQFRRRPRKKVRSNPPQGNAAPPSQTAKAATDWKCDKCGRYFHPSEFPNHGDRWCPECAGSKAEAATSVAVEKPYPFGPEETRDPHSKDHTCQICNWTNTSSNLKIHGRWMCHSCIQRLIPKVQPSVAVETPKWREWWLCLKSFDSPMVFAHEPRHQITAGRQTIKVIEAAPALAEIERLSSLISNLDPAFKFACEERDQLRAELDSLKSTLRPALETKP